MKNPLIDFLAAYGPVANGQNMYDEFVMTAAEQYRIKPLEITEPRSEQIYQMLTSNDPCTIILTGTAGDGKTYTARKVLHRLTNGSEAWTNAQSELSIICSENGQKITFVKDLSEIRLVDKHELVPRVVDSLFGDSESNEVFVLCVNDGHLIKTWRDSAKDERAEKSIQIMQSMLRDDTESASELKLRFINMSRTSHAETLDHIINAITGHSAWNQCAGCPALDAENPCPIRVNREILMREGNQSIRGRLRALIEIAAADDAHLSIRQIIILIVNALLGDSKPSSPSLLNCDRARRRASKSEYAETNPYANLFGENHPKQRRHNLQVFEIMSRFGIGNETTNFFDNVLLENDENRLPNDDYYGKSIFEQIRTDYWEEPAVGYSALSPAIRDQRRRLFFLMPEVHHLLSGNYCDDSPWHLSAYHWGDIFINLLRSKDKRHENLLKLARLGIVKGMNRALNSSLTETQDALWLTRPSGVYLGNETPLLSFDPISWHSSFYWLDLQHPSSPGRPPQINIQTRSQSGQRVTLSHLDLTPTLFEYLMRVARGALPTSFSNQCYQDLRNFQIRSVAAIEHAEKKVQPSLILKAVGTNAEGNLASNPITLLDEVL